MRRHPFYALEMALMCPAALFILLSLGHAGWRRLMLGVYRKSE